MSMSRSTPRSDASPWCFFVNILRWCNEDWRALDGLGCNIKVEVFNYFHVNENRCVLLRKKNQEDLQNQALWCKKSFKSREESKE
jgi:hypothetical protein